MSHTLRTRVYVAGPISIGDVQANVQKAMDLGETLIKLGYAPYIPHLDMALAPKGLEGTERYERALDVDFSVISVCHALIRLPGESHGADREVKWAKEIGVPVYYTLEDLLACV